MAKAIWYHNNRYYGGIEYKDGTLEAIYHNDGRIVPKDGGGYEFEYCIKDHFDAREVLSERQESID